MELVKEHTELSTKILNQHTHGTVVNLQLCVKHLQPMQQVKSVMAIKNRGLEGDRHAMPDSSRQVLLLEQETCIAYDFPIGALRENITTRGIELMSLPKGTRIQVGKALFELTSECTPCSFVEGVKPGLRAELEHKRGMLARVLQGGEIHLGSKIIVVSE